MDLNNNNRDRDRDRNRDRNRHAIPNVLAPAPVIYAGGLVVGWLAEKVVPSHKVYGPPKSNRRTRAIGTGLIGAGLAIGGWAAKTMVMHNTSPDPHHPASELVVTGPFQYSRNPIYLGMTAMYLGICYRWGLTWSSRLLPVVLTVMRQGVIEREEDYLASRFGEEYRAYQGSVGRWFGWGPAWAAYERGRQRSLEQPGNEPAWAKFLKGGR